MTVCVPHELYRTPRLRQAARTLGASGENGVDKAVSFEKRVQSDNAVEKVAVPIRKCSGTAKKDKGKACKAVRAGKI